MPVVARGAGTGLSGGALPLGNGVLLSLAKLMRILEIDPAARTARVQPGVRNLAISEAAAPHGLYYAPDPSSQIACSIGGNVAENSGGVHCLKYGLTCTTSCKLRAITIEGEIVEIGGDGARRAGYDLLALMTGSEGMLAVVTEVTVKLLPKPECAQVVMAAFDDVEKAGAAVANVIGAGIIPAGLEMMDQAATRAVEDFVHAGYPTDVASILLCESDGTDEEVADEMRRVEDDHGSERRDADPRVARRTPSACGSGPGARRRSRRSAASRPTTTAWTARSRASASPRCCGGSPSSSASTGCAARTCSTRATATCIR